MNIADLIGVLDTVGVIVLLIFFVRYYIKEIAKKDSIIKEKDDRLLKAQSQILEIQKETDKRLLENQTREVKSLGNILNGLTAMEKYAEMRDNRIIESIQRLENKVLDLIRNR